ncbi:MAG TPA: hypothetical protein VE422_29410 [Terriglobia bacterium]|nr:hypothetical protein [Terriglobia bacterium]
MERTEIHESHTLAHTLFEAEEFREQDDGFRLHVKGWKYPESVKDFITEEFRDWHENDEITIAIIEKKEEAFTCSRYFEGADAKDEGYAFWLNYHNTWKPGRGRCTAYTIKVMRSDQ